MVPKSEWLKTKKEKGEVWYRLYTIRKKHYEKIQKSIISFTRFSNGYVIGGMWQFIRF